MLALAMLVMFVAACVGLWATWDLTRAETGEPSFDRADVAAPPPSTTEAPSTTAPTDPTSCEFGDEPVVGDPVDDWATIVVDTERRLPPNFEPPDLVDIRRAGFDTPVLVRRILLDDLTALRKGAEANGTPLKVVSAYRSYDYQRQLYDKKVRDEGPTAARLRTARAGHSEHQLGTTVDVLNPTDEELTPAFGRTPAGKWVAAHAHEYGFVFSYPTESRSRSCYEYEPWHLRYVGRELAAEIRESGMTPREWMLAREEGTTGAG